MFLEKKTFFNNGIHFDYKINRPLPFSPKISIFNFLFNNRRNKSLKKINLIRSVKPIKKKIISKRVLSSIFITSLKFLIQFVISSFNNKISSLFCSSNGYFFFSFSTSVHYLFRFYKNSITRNKKLFKCKSDLIFLWKIKRLEKFCAFSFIFGKTKKYALSVGSKAVLIKIDKKKKYGVVRMPSKKTKIMSLYNFVSKGRIKCFSNKKIIFNKAGFLRIRGKKANTRGVAMNPVDHPHGGNTKSLKLHRTPWGLPTKKK